MKQTWSILFSVRRADSVDCEKGFSSRYLEVKAKKGNIDQAKRKILAAIRKEIACFAGDKSKGRFVQIQAIPRIREGRRGLDGSKTLRNRDKFSSPSSVRRIGRNRLFVFGSGPEQVKELCR